jgi:ribosomal protein S18 acetylase RimI-like enzyme
MSNPTLPRAAPNRDTAYVSEPFAVPVEIRLRRPIEADHHQLVAVVDDWWAGRKLHGLLPRLWLQHFTGTSWIAETPDGTLAGFLVGFVSPDHPDLAYIHMVATKPELRKQAIGRVMYEAFFADVAARGARKVTAITWAGNAVSIGFHVAMGFRVVDGPGTETILGVTAFPDYDYAGEDRVVFSRDLAPDR